MTELSQRFEILIKKIYYIQERYNVDATFAMIYHEKPLSTIELGEMIRRSDEIFVIDEQRSFIAFTFTTQPDANRASLNLLQKLDSHFKDKTSCIALDGFDTAKSPQTVLGRLMQILDETRKHSYTRIENEGILDRRM